MATEENGGAAGRWKPNEVRDNKLHEGGVQGTQEAVSLEYTTCSECGQQAGEVIYAEYKTRSGWYCVPCRNFMLAKNRERRTTDG